MAKLAAALTVFMRRFVEEGGLPFAVRKLRHSAEGLSSVRIDAKNRLTYKVEDGVVRVVSCRGHYEDR